MNQEMQRVDVQHDQRLLEARQQFFELGDEPQPNLVNPTILRSWKRCQHFGLDTQSPPLDTHALDRMGLKTEQERHRSLLCVGRPIMEHVYEQIRETGSMVMLTDASGLILETVGDPDFVSRASRILLLAGACWNESLRGTNAIGTAVCEEMPVTVLGSEHFSRSNSFLTCYASPIFCPDGHLVGVLDISGDYRSYQRHTLGLACFCTAIIERRLFEATHARDIILCFHEQADCLGSPKEGLSAISLNGQVLSINRSGVKMLGIRPVDAIGREFAMVFENDLAGLIDLLRLNPLEHLQIRVGNRQLYIQLRGQLPPQTLHLSQNSALPTRKPAALGSPPAGLMRTNQGLDSLDTGDHRLRLAIGRAKKMLGRDIPLLIQGESGTGKEMFVKAFHHSGPRRDAPFVALNCASIPETLIESELFGYAGGAFTGARKEGSPGKIQQAHGGTLFLDEVGDMPLNLQARLLRVLQERCITPLGSARSISVDISLVCATHRQLREEVSRGTFREDLYYRLAGLTLTLPALRERTDIETIVHKLTAQETAQRSLPVRFSENALHVIKRYPWPGNVRQLCNVIRVAVALLNDDETEITDRHLPEELFEVESETRLTNSQGALAPQFNKSGSAASLDEISRQVARHTLEAAGGNVSLAARHLGISRNTLYRKLGRM